MLLPDGQDAFIAIGVLLSLAHFFSHAVSRKLEKMHFRLLSFSAGVFVTFLFLDSIPRVSALAYGPALALLGFACYHVMEKFVYQHRHPSELRRQIGRVHAAGYFLGGFLEGLLVMLVFKVGSQSPLILPAFHPRAGIHLLALPPFGKGKRLACLQGPSKCRPAAGSAGRNAVRRGFTRVKSRFLIHHRRDSLRVLPRRHPPGQGRQTRGLRPWRGCDVPATIHITNPRLLALPISASTAF